MEEEQETRHRQPVDQRPEEKSDVAEELSDPDKSRTHRPQGRPNYYPFAEEKEKRTHSNTTGEVEEAPPSSAREAPRPAATETEAPRAVAGSDAKETKGLAYTAAADAAGCLFLIDLSVSSLYLPTKISSAGSTDEGKLDQIVHVFCACQEVREEHGW